MALDPHKLLATPPIHSTYVFDERDTMLYALGIGAQELNFVYEDQLEVLPMMAVVMAHPGFIWRDPHYGVDWKRIVHGETALQIHRPLPTAGRLTGVTTLGPLFDKGAGKGAVCYQSRQVFDADGSLLATVGAAIFLRGDGGFGGSAEGQPKPHALPERAPDESLALTTTEQQALLYRLSGDRNPLHADPQVATAAGFPRPILHGLCTYGIAGRAVLRLLCGNQPTRLRRLDVRFSNPVYPGETIRTDVWRDGEGRALFRAVAIERGVVVLNNGLTEYA